MNTENDARAQVEATVEWTPVYVERGRVVLRKRLSPSWGQQQERLLKRVEKLVRELQEELAEEQSAYELMARHGGAVNVMEDLGWTVREIEIGPGMLVTADSPVARNLFIRAIATTEGDEIRYTIMCTGEEWRHDFYGLGIEFGVQRRAPAGVIASPETAHRLLRETVEAGCKAHRASVASQVYSYLLAQCGPGAEPDPEEFESMIEACLSGEEGVYGLGEEIPSRCPQIGRP